jgi:hypothetical protein
MMPDLTDEVVIRNHPLFDLAATVRAYDGVFDVRRIWTSWLCSCGRRDCSHIAVVRLEVGDRE